MLKLLFLRPARTEFLIFRYLLNVGAGCVVIELEDASCVVSEREELLSGFERRRPTRESSIFDVE